MYEAILRSSNRPFKATPDIDFYYPAASAEEARQTAVRAVERAEGPVAIMGAAGLGKSMLSEVIANDLCAHFEIVKLHATKLCSRKALLQNILHELQLPYRDMSEGELQLAIMDQLEPGEGRAPGGLAIIVDEAHTLPSKLLEELRLLTNFTRDYQPRARLVLLAGLRLEETLASPELDSFNQRLAARCYLSPMDRRDTQAFVEFQVTSAGLNPGEFITQDGIQSVYAASEGVPRIANQVLDHAIVLAATAGQCPISAALVEEAWADLQQLPVPWQLLSTREEVVLPAVAPDTASAADSTLSTATESSVTETNVTESAGNSSFSSIEFGPLEDDPTETNGDTSFAPVPTDGIDEPEEAELIEEPSDTQAIEQSPNFFAAFSELEEGELPIDVEQQLSVDLNLIDEGDEHAMDLESLDEIQNSDDLETVVDSSLPGDAEENGPHDQDSDAPVEDQVPFVTSQAFFEATPCEEKMVALEAEAHELDAMGVWENDPPLQDGRPIAAEITLNPEELESAIEPMSTDIASADTLPVNESVIDASGNNEDAQAELPADVQNVDQESQPLSSLFGDDFDEELSLEELTQQGNELTSLANSPLDAPPATKDAESLAESDANSPIEDYATASLTDLQLQSEIAAESPIEIESVSNVESLTNTEESPVQQTDDAETLAVQQPSESESEQLALLDEPALADQPLPQADFSDDINGLSEVNLIGEVSQLGNHDGYAIETWDASSSISTSNISTVHVDPVEVTPIDVEREVELHNEIEDLVEQLNFSGSDIGNVVEQLDIEQDAAKNSKQHPEDAIRQGSDDQVYTMHSAVEYSKPEELFTAVDEVDDDRDLLIVEEEIPVQPTTANLKPQKTTRKLPYGQLFSRLRK